MAKITSLAIAVLFGASFYIVPAEAQFARTFVSSLGNDANDCNRLTPCRTFQRAHDQTLALGEITVLDPGGYGAVNITKGISIINDGVGEAGVLVSGGLNGITINAGPTDRVSLRGLTVKGIGFGGGNGIVFITGQSLTIENCAIRNLAFQAGGTGNGVILAPTAASNFVNSNTLIADNAMRAILLRSTAGNVSAVFNRVEVYNNFEGIIVVGTGGAPGTTIQATVVDSVIANNSSSGIGGSTQPGASTTRVLVNRSVVANNSSGLAVDGLFFRIGQSAVTGNGNTYLVAGGAVLQSFGDNYVTDNLDGNPLFPSVINRQ